MISMKKLLQKITAEVNKLHPLVNSSSEFVEKKALIWQNPSPTSSFNAQTISLSLSAYQEIAIEWMHISGSSTQRCLMSRNVVGASSFYNYSTNDSLKYARGRDFEVTTSSVVFSNAKTDGTTDNTVCIPYRIYGIKRIYGGGVN